MFINSVLLRVLPQKPFIYSFRYLRSNHQQCLPNVFISTQYATDVTVTAVPKPKVVNKAMNAYLIRAKEHDQFMKVQDEEYHIGKRHLANMMGEDPETFTQEDVDNAIAYLFPSGLFDSRARPFMKPPEEVYPQRKAAEFDETGRPFHSMFYTGKANFYKLLYDIVEHINEVNSFEDRMLRKQTTVDPALQLTLFGMQWITKDELENELVESLADLEYQHFVIAMERLVSLPYSYRIKDFILKYRKPLLEQSTTYEIAKPKYDTDGRMYVTTYECLRKKARGNVTVRSPGSGKISINGQDITYFEHMQPREQAATPKLMVQWRTVPDGMIEQQYPSDGFEYMECGPSPPAENVPINMYDKFEESVADLNIQVCKESIRNSLIDQMKASGGRSKLLDDIEHGQILSSNVVSRFENSIKLEKNISFLWSCFLKRWDLLDGLICVGAESGFYDSNGISGLHLAAYSGCLTCTSFLISKAIDVNLQPKFHTPLHFAAFGNSTETAKMLISNGASINMCTAKQNCDESLLHCAVRANAVECIKLFIQEGADVNSLKPNGTNPIHLAADLGLAQSLKVLLESPRADPNIRICIREKESTALHLASDEGNAECVNLLLAKGADAALKNHRGFTPLHLAARTSSLECVESLLRNGSANPNAEDFDHRTPLHAAVGKSDYSFDILETLIAWGANINHKDVFGFTALHLAALDGLAPCVEMLIFHGADVTTKSRKGTSALNVITRKTPQSLAMIHHKLDAAISLHQSQETATREVELELDFRQLMQHCHPREISFLHTFIKEGQKEFLEHPLCSAFLYIKWGKIRKFFIARLLFCFITVLFLSLYVLTALAHSCYNGSKDMNETLRDQELCQKQSILGDMLRKNPFVIEMQWWVLVVIIIAEIVRKLYGLTGYSSVKHYVTQIENIIEWFVIISVFLTSYIYNKRTDTWQNHIAAFAVLLGWTNLMLMIGQLPVFGVYVSMYTKVQVEFGKLFMAYSCMLIGFTISFCVIFPDSPVFSNPFMGFITVLVLMIGEQDLTLLTNEPDGQDPPVLLEISAQITFVLFLLFVTVILMNLLVGIAVNDIQALKKTAELSKLVRQTELILYIESALFKKYLPVWLKKILHNTALVSPQAYRAVLCLKPLNPGEKRLPKDILMRAYEVAKERNVQDTSTSTYDSPDSFGQLDKFKIDNNNVKTPLPPAPDSDYVFDTVSLCALTTKIDENAEKIDSLTNDIRELKSVLHQNDHVIDQLLLFLANQQKK